MPARTSRDVVVLRTPRGPSALRMFCPVVGGVASRHDLPVDRLDDLLLALETLLAGETQGQGELILTISVLDRRMLLRLDGLLSQSVKAALERDAPARERGDWLPDVRVLLDSLLDAYHVVDGSADSFAVEMEKRAS